MITKPTTLSDVIDLMAASLENPVIKIDMSTFGYNNNGICVGCAATATLITLGADPALLQQGPNPRIPCEGFSDVYKELWIADFEQLVNQLRSGRSIDLQLTFRLLKKLDIAYPLCWLLFMPTDVGYLTSDYTPKDIQPYREWAALLRNAGY